MMSATAGSSVIAPHQISHGTIECNDVEKTRHFLVDFLGLDVVRALREAQYISKGGAWSVVCVTVGKTLKPQPYDKPLRGQRRHRRRGRRRARQGAEHEGEFGIREVRDVTESDGVRTFALQDLNGSWWEVSNFTPDMLDAVFDKAA